MAAITSCPKCEKHVAVPEGAAAEAEVRCPLCNAEFALADASTEVPALIVVGADSAAAEDIAFAPLDDDATVDELALDDAGLDLGLTDEAADAEAGSDAGEKNLDELEETVEGDGIDFGLLDDDAVGDDESAKSGIDFAAFGDTGDGDLHDGDAGDADGGFNLDTGGGEADLGAVASFGGESATKSASEKAKPEKKKRKGPGPVGQIVGIVVFGIIGLCLGYVILLWVKPSALAPINGSMKFLDSVAAVIGPADAVQKIYEGPPPAEESDSGFGPIGGALTEEENTLRPPEHDGSGSPSYGSGSHGTDVTNSAAPANSFAALFADGSVPSFTLEDLQKARRNVGRRIDAADLAEKKREKDLVKSTRTKLYQRISDLAGAATFFDAEIPQETDGELAQVRTQLETAVSTASRQKTFERFAYRWLFSGKRKPEKTGALVVGRVAQMTTVGDRTQLDVEVAGRSSDPTETVRVLLTNGNDVAEGDKVALVGTIVDLTETTLSGYDSDQPLVVLSRVVVPLAE